MIDPTVARVGQWRICKFNVGAPGEMTYWLEWDEGTSVCSQGLLPNEPRWKALIDASEHIVVIEDELRSMRFMLASVLRGNKLKMDNQNRLYIETEHGTPIPVPLTKEDQGPALDDNNGWLSEISKVC